MTSREVELRRRLRGAAQRRDALTVALDETRDEIRHLARLARAEGMSLAAIAVELAITKPSVHKMLARSRRP